MGHAADGAREERKGGSGGRVGGCEGGDGATEGFVGGECRGAVYYGEGTDFCGFYTGGVLEVCGEVGSGRGFVTEVVWV